MPRDNKTRYALLGFLSLSPMSGYDIKKMCDKSIKYFWNENLGNIYPVLKKMEEEKLVSMERHYQEDSPDKKVYSITDEGCDQLRKWLKHPPDIRKLREELLLQVFFGDMCSPMLLVEKIKERKKLCKILIRELNELKDYLLDKYGRPLDEQGKQRQASVTYWLQTISFGLRLYHVELEWCDESIQVFTELAHKEEDADEAG